MAKSKKERKNQRKRDRERRAVAKETRRKLRAKIAEEQEVLIEPPEDSLAPTLMWSDASNKTTGETIRDTAGDSTGELSEIDQWWDQFTASEFQDRIAMVEAIVKDGLQEQSLSDYFPDAVLECEGDHNASQYIELLEHLASNHREVYRTGLSYFLQSRVVYYLSIGDSARIESVLSQDTAEMEAVDESYFGTVSILRLGEMDEAADTLSATGIRLLESSALMSWAVHEIYHAVVFKSIRHCVQSGASEEALQQLEDSLRDLGEIVDDRNINFFREMAVLIAGQQPVQWNRNQLVGSAQKAADNRTRLGYGFVGWLAKEHSISLSAADELRTLAMDSIDSGSISMRDYFKGVSERLLKQHLISMLGFLSLENYKLPATLIAIKHFVHYLAQLELIDSKTVDRTRAAIDSVEAEFRRARAELWTTFPFFDRLRRPSS